MKHEQFRGAAQTTDGVTVVPVVVCDMPPSSVTVCEFLLIGRASDGRAATAKFTQVAKNVGGVVTLLGSLTSVFAFTTGSDAGLTGCVASTDVVGSVTVRLKVRGVAGVTIAWEGRFIAVSNLA